MPNDPNHPNSSDPYGLTPDDFDDDDALDDEFPDFAKTDQLDAELEATHSPSSRPKAKPAGAESTQSIQKEASPIDHIDISHIPLKIQLEIARISVSLDELQKMKPGSKLPIDINPRIVNLVVGGKSIGQGEIIEIGDIVGVKILELYK